jgi:Arc/MetJ family transcription regulator
MMRTTLALDEDLVAEAQRYTELKEKSALVREGLRALIERESARRIAHFGGTDPGAKAPRRRRISESDPRRHLHLDRPFSASFQFSSSLLEEGAALWTRDKRLTSIAARLGLSADL